MHGYLQERPRKGFVGKCVPLLNQGDHGLVGERASIGVKELQSDLIVILFVLCRQQAIPVHAINLERHEDVLSQHLLKVVCLLFVAFRHDKPHQVLVQVVVHVDLVKLTLLNQAY